ncbi:hypothetical protein AAY473_012084, partial [Plecturocebus cupreus]
MARGDGARLVVVEAEVFCLFTGQLIALKVPVQASTIILHKSTASHRTASDWQDSVSCSEGKAGSPGSRPSAQLRSEKRIHSDLNKRRFTKKSRDPLIADPLKRGHLHYDGPLGFSEEEADAQITKWHSRHESQDHQAPEPTLFTPAIDGLCLSTHCMRESVKSAPSYLLKRLLLTVACLAKQFPFYNFERMAVGKHHRQTGNCLIIHIGFPL